LKDYFSQNAFTSMNTEGFISYITNYYAAKFDIELSRSLFDQWIFTEGLPESAPRPKSSRFTGPEKVLQDWQSGQKLNSNFASAWSTHEWLHFLKNLPDTLSREQMKALDDFGNFTSSGNAEITTLWLTQAIRHNYEQAYPKLEDFLLQVGRRKFLLPLYTELKNTPNGLARAKEIYSRARPNYHFVAVNTLDQLLK
jgi:leukotriene-A4 hydrolase